MPTLTTLPCEIVVAILTELDDFQSLASSLLTCRYVYGCFKEGHGVETSLVRRHVTPALLPYAVATLEMSQLPKQCPYSRVYGLLNALYYNPDQLVGHMKTMPRKTLQKILRMYDIIHDLVKEYAKKAWLRFGQKRADPDSPGFTLSHDEHFRFCRAFYRVEIFYSLFRHSGNDSNNGTFMVIANHCFFSRHAPWENEQLGCVSSFLESMFARGKLRQPECIWPKAYTNACI